MATATFDSLDRALRSLSYDGQNPSPRSTSLHWARSFRIGPRVKWDCPFRVDNLQPG